MKKKIMIAILLVILSIGIRLSYRTPHHPDHYTWLNYSHAMIRLGYAPWILHPLSLIGYYPLSVPSGIEFFTATVHFLAEMDLQSMYLYLSPLIALFGALNVYLLMRSWKSYETSILSAFVLLTMAFFAKDTSFTASNRILNIVFYPLFILILFKIREFWSINKWISLKYVFLDIILGIAMMLIHRLSQLLLIFLLSFFAALVVQNWKKLLAMFQKTRIYHHRKVHYQASRLHIFIDILIVVLLMAGWVLTKSKVTFFAFAIFTLYYYISFIMRANRSEKRLFADIIIYCAILVITKMADLAIRSRLLVHLAKYLPSANYYVLWAIVLMVILFFVIFYVSFHRAFHSWFDFAFGLFHRAVHKVLDIVEHDTDKAISIGLFMVFIFMILATFTGKAFITVDRSYYYDSFLLKGTSALVVAVNWIFNLNNNLTVLIVFSIIGVLSIIFKKKKDFADYFFIIAVVGFSQFIFDWEYIRLYMNPIYAMLIAIGLVQTIRLVSKRISRTLVYAGLIILLLVHLSVAGFFMHREYFLDKLGIQEDTLDILPDAYYIDAGTYLQDDTPEDFFSVVSSSPTVRANMFAHYSGLADAVDAQSIFIDRSVIELRSISWDEIRSDLLSGKKVTYLFYLKDWILPGTYYHGRHIFNYLSKAKDKIINRIAEYYKIKYFIDTDRLAYESKETQFKYIEPYKNKIYNNGGLAIFDLSKGSREK